MRGHLEELRSLLTQSSWEVASPLPTMPHVLRFFLPCVVPSPSEPDSHWTWEETGAQPRAPPRSTRRPLRSGGGANPAPVLPEAKGPFVTV